MRVIGTAGHVDHGKSTLVRTLSGIDPDRLKEEKTRGMTIDLGFAWIKLAIAGQSEPENVGIVDVPGHIDFIKNMLAGVSGLDAVMLVIAADEGVMPQTREHLAILDLLKVPAAVVALTKVDLVDDPEWLELVELDISELLDQTHLAGAPIVRVSSTTTHGLVELRRRLADTLGKLPPRRNRARPRLPIDRIFTISGFGTVVTGTLQDGELSVGDAVEIMPSALPARIRSLQVHKQPIEHGQPGSRLAINLTGVGVEQLNRGDVVIKPGTVQATQLLDVHFRLLADAPKALEHNQAVDFFCTATEVSANVRLLGAENLEPGEEGWLQLRLEKPVVVAAGDRYILRQASPSLTLGGGDVLSPHPQRRWKRNDSSVIARLHTLAKGSPDEILLQTLQRRPLITAKELFTHSELDLAVAQQALQEISAAGAVLSIDAGEIFYCTLDSWDRITIELLQLLGEFHQQSRLRRGMLRGEVRSRLQSQSAMTNLSVRLFNALIERAKTVSLLGADDALIWKSDFSVQLNLAQQQVVDHVLQQFAATPFSPPNLADTLRTLGEPELLEMLIEQGQLLRLGDGVLFQPAIFGEIMEKIVAHLRANSSITLAAVRDLFNTSRKYAQAVLEEMDARRITRRDGDNRVLR